MKHAYCIIAHSEPEILNILIKMIDDVRNDIYLLIDKKTNADIYSNIGTIHSALVYAPRVDIRWGGGSQIEAELILFEMAYKHGPYAYYHLLSGVDLPLKSQNYIHQFMDENKGKEFVGFATGLSAQKDLYYPLAELKAYNFYEEKVAHIIGI